MRLIERRSPSRWQAWTQALEVYSPGTAVGVEDSVGHAVLAVGDGSRRGALELLELFGQRLQRDGRSESEPSRSRLMGVA